MYVCVAAGFGGTAWAGPPPWSFFGGDTTNSRGHPSGGYNVGTSIQINSRNVSRLALKWSYTTVGDISATPTVDATGVYFPDFAGNLYSLNPSTGALNWVVALSSFLNGGTGVSHASPAIGALGEIVIGNNAITSLAPGARLMSINKSNGTLNWVTQVDSNPRATITSSPVIYNGIVYVGITSTDEGLTATVANFVPTSRGSVVAVNESTGKVIWQTYMVPTGYAGGGVWASSPVIYSPGKAVIVGTGNNTAVPASVASCYTKAGSNIAAQYTCMDPTNYVDSIVALNLNTGAPIWSRRFGGADTWVAACSQGPASECPSPAGLDTDFAQDPGLVYNASFIGKPDDRGGTGTAYFLGAGEKSSYYYGLNPANGGEYWATYVGKGQILWGSAIDTDDRNSVVVALENNGHATNTLVGQVGGKPVSWNGGAWGAINLLTGAIIWQVPTVGNDLVNPKVGGAAPGPVTQTNRVVFGGSTSGYYVCMDSNSGKTLWTYNAGASILGGPSVYDETLYWGAGAVKFGPGSIHKLFAFAIPPS